MPVSLDGYVHAVLNSGLLTEDRLNEALRALPRGEKPEPEALAAQLEASNLLTRWQNELLLAGKYKGFFLGKYRLLDLLGCGGMGQVFYAEHTLMRRRVAIKVLPKKFLADADAVERFHREAQAIAAVDHPNIVHAYSVDNDGDLHYLVMEYVAGRDLARRVVDRGPLSCAQAADFIRQAADGLEHAHSRGLIHRDIKPANLLVDGEGFVKILDLGLARLAGSEHTPTEMEDATVRGTLDYMSPEQAMDSRSVDARADLYSLGCTFYFLLSGRPPFTGASMAELILAHQSREPLDLRDLRPDLTDDLWAILKRMMAKRPEDRFASAGELSGELVEWRRQHVGDEATATIAQGDTISADFRTFLDKKVSRDESPPPASAPPARVLTHEEPEAEPSAVIEVPRRKLLVPLLAGSLAALAIVGGMAWEMLGQDQDDLAQEGAAVRREFGEVRDIAWNDKQKSAATAAAKPPEKPKPKPVDKPKPKPQEAKKNDEKKNEDEKKPEERKTEVKPDSTPAPTANAKSPTEKSPEKPANPPKPKAAVEDRTQPEMTFGESGSSTVVVEAEHFTAAFAQGDSKWQDISHPHASGEKAMEAAPNQGAAFDDKEKFEQNGPRLDFRVYLNKKARYYVWVRGLAKGGTDDSCHVGINGKTRNNCKHLTGFGEQFGWVRTTHDKFTPYVDVSKAGWYTLNVWMREDGLIVDKVVITSDPKFEAKGSGPAETPRMEEEKKAETKEEKKPPEKKPEEKKGDGSADNNVTKAESKPGEGKGLEEAKNGPKNDDAGPAKPAETPKDDQGKPAPTGRSPEK